MKPYYSDPKEEEEKKLFTSTFSDHNHTQERIDKIPENMKQCLFLILESVKNEEKRITKGNEHAQEIPFKHKFDYFKLACPLLEVIRNNTVYTIEEIIESEEPYQLSQMCQLEFVCELKSDFQKEISGQIIEGTQVIKYSGSPSGKAKYYILKRSYMKVEFSKNLLLNFSEEKFIAKKFHEYKMMKIFGDFCSYGCKIYGFQIILYEICDYLMTELLMEYAGETISSFEFQSKEQKFEAFRQSIEALQFLEALRIEHNDIKGSNILILKTEHKHFMNIQIKIIDFDIGEIQSNTKELEKSSNIKGISMEVAPPELINSFDKPDSQVNPWKAQIYCLAMLFLKILDEFFNKDGNAKYNSSIYRKNISMYCYFMKALTDFVEDREKFKPEMDIEIYMYRIITICLNFDPNKRFTAGELSLLMKNISKFVDSSFETEYNKIIEYRNKNSDKDKIKIKELEEKVMQLEQKLKKAEENLEFLLKSCNLSELNNKCEHYQNALHAALGDNIENQKLLQIAQFEINSFSEKLCNKDEEVKKLRDEAYNKEKDYLNQLQEKQVEIESIKATNDSENEKLKNELREARLNLTEFETYKKENRSLKNGFESIIKQVDINQSTSDNLLVNIDNKITEEENKKNSEITLLKNENEEIINNYRNLMREYDQANTKNKKKDQESKDEIKSLEFIINCQKEIVLQENQTDQEKYKRIVNLLNINFNNDNIHINNPAGNIKPADAISLLSNNSGYMNKPCFDENLNFFGNQTKVSQNKNNQSKVPKLDQIYNGPKTNYNYKEFKNNNGITNRYKQKIDKFDESIKLQSTNKQGIILPEMNTKTQNLVTNQTPSGKQEQYKLLNDMKKKNKNINSNVNTNNDISEKFVSQNMIIKAVSKDNSTNSENRDMPKHLQNGAINAKKEETNFTGNLEDSTIPFTRQIAKPSPNEQQTSTISDINRGHEPQKKDIFKKGYQIKRSDMPKNLENPNKLHKNCEAKAKETKKQGN